MVSLLKENCHGFLADSAEILWILLLKGGSCNGAEISLFYKDQNVYSSTLTSLEHFKIPKLKKLESYKFVITWAKYQLTQTRQVIPGDFV